MIRMMNQGRSFSSRERNCCFLNVAGERFATVSGVSGLDYPDDGRAIAVVDWDQDGDLDLWISNRNAPRLRFMRNNSTRYHHSLVLRLIGNGNSSNRDAIGARVEVVSKGLEGKRLIRTLRAGEGLLSQSSKLIHFGLGQLEQIEKIIVNWPGGDIESFTDINVDGRYELEQGSGKARSLKAVDRALALESNVRQSVKSSSAMRVPMITLLPMPQEVSYIDFEDAKRRLRFGNGGKPTLVVLWASWCAPCRTELAALVSREDEIRSAGIDVVVLTVDGLTDDGTEPDAAKLLCEQLKVSFATGKAAPEFVQLLTGYHHMLVAIKKPLPVPSSFLIDQHGQLSVIYKGTFDIDQFLDDAKFEPQSMRQRTERAASLPGRMIDHDAMLDPLRRSEANTLCGLAKGIASGGRFADAIPLFRRALENEPDFGEAHLELARALESTNRFGEAAPEYERAIELFPDSDVLNYRLGNIWVRLAKWENAVSSYSETIRLNPGYWEALASRANVLMKLDREVEAAADYRQVLKINPNYLQAKQALKVIDSKNDP
ncbi:MAG: tetratricopeptide (TPR) repeat protein [Mariniblastus sp.]|jgi:tetratricopeptide (TPR) repeat protein